MAAYILHSLTDDNPDLQKQLGCGTGIFQLFDQHHIMSGRRLVGHSHRRGHQGTSYNNSGHSETGSNNAYLQRPAPEMNSKKNAYERQRLSTESSRLSFSSSSCSSSLSSIDYNRTAQPEHSSFDRMTFPETTSRDSSVNNHASESPKLGHQSLNLRDLVKESMYRETRGLRTVQTTSKEGSLSSRIVTLKDSPRPLSVSKSVNGSYGYGINDKQNTYESIRGLTKLRDAPWQEASDDAHMHTISKDHPRFSYDGRETNRLPFESWETIRSTRKIKDLPRLSLDGREGSGRSVNSDSQSNFNPQNWQKGNGNNSDDQTQIIPQAPLAQKRPPSVVAKLMGLDALPDSTSASDRPTELVKSRPIEDHTKTTGLIRSIQTNDSSINSWKGPASPRWQNQDSGMRPLSSSRFPIEPAPWKQQPDASRGSLKPGLKQLESPTRASNTFPSVYSEIETRLKDLEFNQSGKDLRALKQILEAMLAKGLLQTEKEERDSKEYGHKLANRNQKLITQHNPHRTQVGTSSRNLESPIVIMKPAKLVHKTSPSSRATTDGSSSLNNYWNEHYSDSRHSSVNVRTAKHQTSTSKNSNPNCDLGSINRNSNSNSNGKVLRPAQSSSKPQLLPKEGATSPRMQQKKLELDKRSRPPIPSTDKRKPRRQLTESSSPGRKLRQNNHNVQQQSDDQLSEVSVESRDSSYQGDNTSLHSEGNTSIDSKLDSEVTSLRRRSSDGSRSPSMKTSKHTLDNKSSSILNENGLNSLIEFASVSPQHPSPISVLDASVYKDDSSSPVDMESALQDDEPQSLVNNCVEKQVKIADCAGTGVSSEINRKKLQNIDNLVQKLRRLNSSHDEARTDYIASLCDKTSTDHRYISEILLASGLLLRDLSSTLTTFQLHPSGQPINPELFFVLEQTKSSTLLSNIDHVPDKNLDNEKAHRKLIFTAVNELLITKFGLLASCSHPSMKRPAKLATKNMTAQQLLRELCTEIDKLQESKMQCNNNNNVDEEKEDRLKKFLSDDVMYGSENWTDFSNETSGLILDVERWLFKELVDEIIGGEAATARLKPSRGCRKLFEDRTRGLSLTKRTQYDYATEACLN